MPKKVNGRQEADDEEQSYLSLFEDTQRHTAIASMNDGLMAAGSVQNTDSVLEPPHNSSHILNSQRLDFRLSDNKVNSKFPLGSRAKSKDNRVISGNQVAILPAGLRCWIRLDKQLNQKTVSLCGVLLRGHGAHEQQILVVDLKPKQGRQTRPKHGHCQTNDT